MENNFINPFFASTQIQNVESTYRVGNLNEMTSNLKSVIFPKTQTLNAIDSVVLVLDVIEDYENLFSKSSIDSINKLVKNAEKFNIPIIFTKWERIENSKIKDVIDKKRPLSYYIKRKSNFIKSIYIPRNVTIIKTKYTDAFAESLNNINLIDLIGNRKNLVICGCWTHACVRNTCVSAAYNNIFPYVLKDGTNDINIIIDFISKLTINNIYGAVVKDIKFK